MYIFPTLFHGEISFTKWIYITIWYTCVQIEHMSSFSRYLYWWKKERKNKNERMNERRSVVWICEYIEQEKVFPTCRGDIVFFFSYCPTLYTDSSYKFINVLMHKMFHTVTIQVWKNNKKQRCGVNMMKKFITMDELKVKELNKIISFKKFSIILMKNLIGLQVCAVVTWSWLD